jgi:hypothetical protein
MGMLQVGGGLDFLEEPVDPDHRAELGAEHLDRDLAGMPEVLGQIHHRHPALAQLPLESVAVTQHRR